jgi:hypothetical protein
LGGQYLSLSLLILYERCGSSTPRCVFYNAQRRAPEQVRTHALTRLFRALLTRTTLGRQGADIKRALTRSLRRCVRSRRNKLYRAASTEWFPFSAIVQSPHAQQHGSEACTDITMRFLRDSEKGMSPLHICCSTIAIERILRSISNTGARESVANA